jgi:hypothetical protein
LNTPAFAGGGYALRLPCNPMSTSAPLKIRKLLIFQNGQNAESSTFVLFIHVIDTRDFPAHPRFRDSGESNLALNLLRGYDLR